MILHSLQSILLGIRESTLNQSVVMISIRQLLSTTWISFDGLLDWWAENCDLCIFWLFPRENVNWDEEISLDSVTTSNASEVAINVVSFIKRPTSNISGHQVLRSGSRFPVLSLSKTPYGISWTLKIPENQIISLKRTYNWYCLQYNRWKEKRRNCTSALRCFKETTQKKVWWTKRW